MNGSGQSWANDIAVRRKAGLPVPGENPALVWPSISYSSIMQNCDLFHFPDRSLVTQRYGSDEKVITLGLQLFQLAVKQAEACVLVLDLFFDEVGTRVLGPALEYTKAEDIRLLTGRGKIGDERRMQLHRTLRKLRNMNAGSSSATEIYWTAGLSRGRFPYLHDRFAIVDGGLWHFGSTVGGGSRELTAASGPWPVGKTRAIEFFDECWREHGD